MENNDKVKVFSEWVESYFKDKKETRTLLDSFFYKEYEDSKSEYYIRIYTGENKRTFCVARLEMTNGYADISTDCDIQLLLENQLLISRAVVNNYKSLNIILQYHKENKTIPVEKMAENGWDWQETFPYMDFFCLTNYNAIKKDFGFKPIECSVRCRFGMDVIIPPEKYEILINEDKLEEYLFNIVKNSITKEDLSIHWK